MPPDRSFNAGFCFTAVAADNVTTAYVNVCGTQEVERPLSRGMDPVSDELLDLHGVDNLVIPIAVGHPRLGKESLDPSPHTGAGGTVSVVVIDVVVHEAITKRCVPSHRLFQHFVDRTAILAMEWIRKETGWRLNEATRTFFRREAYKSLPGESLMGRRTTRNGDRISVILSRADETDGVSSHTLSGGKLDSSIAFLGKERPSQRPGKDGTTKPIGADELVQEVAAMCKQLLDRGDPAAAAAPQAHAQPAAGAGAAAHAPRGAESVEDTSDGAVDSSPFLLRSGSSAQAAAKKPLVVEVPKTQGGLRKGFLADALSGKGGGSTGKPVQLYGAEGTSEGSPGASVSRPTDGADPQTQSLLAHLPPGLRERCRIVDTRMSESCGGTLPKSAGSPQASARPEVPLSDTSSGNGNKRRGGSVDPPACQVAQSLPNAEDSEGKWILLSNESQAAGNQSKGDGACNGSVIVVRLASPAHVSSMADVNLTVEPNRMILSDAHDLIVPMPHPVHVENATAKYIKSKRILVVTCPVQRDTQLC